MFRRNCTGVQSGSKDGRRFALISPFVQYCRSCAAVQSTGPYSHTSFKRFVRLSALVPPPWLNLTRYHGVFAARSRLRSDVVSRPTHAPPAPTDQLSLAGIPPGHAPVPRSGTLMSTRRTLSHTPGRHPWAYLLRRTFKVDVTVCPVCTGALKLEQLCTDRGGACWLRGFRSGDGGGSVEGLDQARGDTMAGGIRGGRWMLHGANRGFICPARSDAFFSNLHLRSSGSVFGVSLNLCSRDRSKPV